MEGREPVCPKCKGPLRRLTVPKIVEVGLKVAAVGSFAFVFIPLSVIVASWLKASPTGWKMIEPAILAGCSAIFATVGLVIHRINRRSLYFCDTCHRRYDWRKLASIEANLRKTEAA